MLDANCQGNLAGYMSKHGERIEKEKALCWKYMTLPQIKALLHRTAQVAEERGDASRAVDLYILAEAWESVVVQVLLHLSRLLTVQPSEDPDRERWWTTAQVLRDGHLRRNEVRAQVRQEVCEAFDIVHGLYVFTHLTWFDKQYSAALDVVQGAPLMLVPSHEDRSHVQNVKQRVLAYLSQVSASERGKDRKSHPCPCYIFMFIYFYVY